MPSPLTIVPLLGFAGMAVAFAMGATGPQREAGTGYLDRPMPVFDQPPMPGTGAGFASADLEGRVSIINVFASWCSACRQEHPTLLKLAAATEVPIYGLDWKDDPGAGKVFLARMGNPYHATADDRSGELGLELGVTGVPETYIVDAGGRLRYRHIGPITDAIWADVLLPLLDQLGAPS